MIETLTIEQARAAFPGKVPDDDAVVKNLSARGRWPRLYRAPGVEPAFRKDELVAFLIQRYGGLR